MTLGIDGSVSCDDHTRTISVTKILDKLTVHSIFFWSATDLSTLTWILLQWYPGGQ